MDLSEVPKGPDMNEELPILEPCTTFPKQDLTGLRFGKLTVVGFAGKWKHEFEWWCDCDCGSRIHVRGNNLRSGNTTQCTTCSRNNRLHNIDCTNRQLYRLCYNRARGAYDRCTNESNYAHKHYVGKWHFQDIHVFAKYIYDLAIKANLDYKSIIAGDYQIDKIDDDLGYVEGNIQWITGIANRRKRSCTPWVTLPDGSRETLLEFSKENNIPEATAYKRYQRYGDNIKELLRPHNVIYIPSPDGRDYTLAELSKISGICKKTIEARYEICGPNFELLIRPIGARVKKYES